MIMYVQEWVSHCKLTVVGTAIERNSPFCCMPANVWESLHGAGLENRSCGELATFRYLYFS